MNIKTTPFVYIPTLYFAEGLPYTIVMMVSGIMFKSLGADNEFIGHTSLLYLPWVLKFLWAPLVDSYSTKRTWIVVAQVVLACVSAVLACVVCTGQAIVLSLVVMIVLALVSATQDIAIDGYYLDALDKDKQALFVGIRSAAYKVAWLFGSGALVYWAGIWGAGHGGDGWMQAYAICAAIFVLCAGAHALILPQPQTQAADTVAVTASGGHVSFFKAMAGFFAQPRIAWIVAYILLFRLGDALMLKQAPNFLLDPADKGGLGLTVSDVGVISGTVGMVCLLAGGIIGSWLVARGGLRRWMWPAAIIQNSAILLYWRLAAFKLPEIPMPELSQLLNVLHISWPVFWVSLVNGAEQLSYGLGVAVYTVFLMTTVKSEYRASHYAMATALMAAGVMIPGYYSGELLKQLGYPGFFLLSFLASIPGIIAIFFLPIWKTEPGSSSHSGGNDNGVSQAGQVGSQSK